MGEFQHLFHSAFGVSCMLLHGYLRPVPKETGAYLAAGNTASCTAQGFFDSFFYGLSVVMNSVLAFTYCIMVKKGKKDEATRASRRLVSDALSNDVHKQLFILMPPCLTCIYSGARATTDNMSFTSDPATLRSSIQL